MESCAIEIALMELNTKNIPRKRIQRSFRIFEDQLESLREIARVKYRGRRNVSDLLRDFLDRGIDLESTSEWK
jgi:nucleoid-associated protein YejK